MGGKETDDLASSLLAEATNMAAIAQKIGSRAEIASAAVRSPIHRLGGSLNSSLEPSYSPEAARGGAP